MTALLDGAVKKVFLLPFSVQKEGSKKKNEFEN